MPDFHLTDLKNYEDFWASLTYGCLCSSAARKHSATLTKTALPLAELRLLNAGKWWFGPVDGFDVQIPYRIVRLL